MELKAENLSIGFGKEKVIFPNINFSVGKGNMIALLGVNGIGKSTLLRTISGLQKQLAGKLIINGQELQEVTALERSKLISVVLTERMMIDNITVRDFISLGRAPYTSWLGKLSEEDEKIINEVISLMKVEKLESKLFNQTSDGEKQKVLIARALCQQTPVIILDEPSAFLDFRNKREILELLSGITTQLNKIVIFSTHDIEASLEYCSKCWIMTEEKQFREVGRSTNFSIEIKTILQSVGRV